MNKREVLRLLMVTSLLIMTMVVSMLARRSPHIPEVPAQEQIQTSPDQITASTATQVRMVRLPPPKLPVPQSSVTKMPDGKAERPQKQVDGGRPKPLDLNAGGPVPAAGEAPGGLSIVAEFACEVEYYLAEMRQRGGRLVVYERTGKKFFDLTPVGAVHPVDKLAGDFSPITRRLTQDYPDAQRLLKDVEHEWGAGRYEVLLLVPTAYEANLYDMITKALPSDIKSLPGTVRVRYLRTDGGLAMEIVSYVAGDREVSLNRLVMI